MAPPPASSRIPLAERRRRILETAVQVYAQQGFHQTGMRQLCAALGMSAGALYRYFPGKEAIIAGLVEMDREMVQRHLSAIPPGVGFLETLTRMMEVTLGELSTNAGLLGIWAEISSEATRHPAVAALLTSHYQFIENLLESLAAAGLASGELRAGLKPRAIARLVMAAHDGMMTRLAIDPTYPLQQTATETLELLATGIVAPPAAAAPASAQKRRKSP